MTHSLKRTRSRFEWFRMDVPARHRERVGKTSWQHSLETSEPTLAAIKRSELSLHYKRLVRELDAELAAAVPARVAAYVDACLDELVRYHDGSRDRAMQVILGGIANVVRSSWSPNDAEAVEARRVAAGGSGIYDEAALPLIVFDEQSDRDIYLLREKLLEGTGVVDGMVYQEMATLLRTRRLWQAAPTFYLPFVVPDHDRIIERHEELAAEILFDRLIEHRFSSWPDAASDAFARPASVPEDVPTQSIVARPALVASTSLVARSDASPTVQQAFAAWHAHSKARLKSRDEFRGAISRFVAAFGDMDVDQIDRRTARAFRNLLASLPAQAPKAISTLPPREQAEIAAREGMRLLSPTTVKKQLQALYTTLGHARDEMDAIVQADAFGVSVDCSEVMGDERLGFSSEHMQTLFSAPLMTTTQGEDAAFWFMLLGPLTGCRVEELAQLRPGDVRVEDGVCFIDIRRESVSERRARPTADQASKRVKTRTSLRRIPLHPVLIEAGFNQFANNAAKQNSEWLFELKTFERYEQRGKYMSNALNRHIDRVGITDPEYVYHSFRHTLKATLRDLDSVKEEISDLLTGHSFAISVGRRYGRGAGLHTLRRAVEQIVYPTVNWKPVVAAAQQRVAAIAS